MRRKPPKQELIAVAVGINTKKEFAEGGKEALLTAAAAMLLDAKMDGLFD